MGQYYYFTQSCLNHGYRWSNFFYNLEDLIIPPDPKSKYLMEFCVKVLLKGDITIYPGEEVLVESACIIRKGIMEYCLHILKNEKILLTLTSKGYISELFGEELL